MILTRPLVSFDLESTGLSVTKDRIVSIAAMRVVNKKINSGMETIGAISQFSTLINPTQPLSPESSEVHGITDEMVKDAPKFHEKADELLAFMDGCDLLGYNLLRFDLPLLSEELDRCGKILDLNGVNIIDAGNIFKLKETRTLEAAMLFYCGKAHEDAHSADADVEATIEVLRGQLARYGDLGNMTVPELAKFSHMDDNIDLAGKLIRDKDGDACYGFGDKKGTKVKNDTGLAYWILSKDFPSNTKRHVQAVLDEIYAARDTQQKEGDVLF